MNYWKIIDTIDYRLEPRNGGDRYNWCEVDRMEKIRSKAVYMLNRKIRLNRLKLILGRETDDWLKDKVQNAIANYDKWSEDRQFDEVEPLFTIAEREYGLTPRELGLLGS